MSLIPNSLTIIIKYAQKTMNLEVKNVRNTEK